MNLRTISRLAGGAAALAILAAAFHAGAQTSPPMSASPMSSSSMSSGAMAASPMAPAGQKHLQITIQNLTAGQPFSPSVFVTHAPNQPGLFKLGDKASDGIVAIAEGGNIGGISGMAAKGYGTEFGDAAAAIHTLPGQTRTLEITVDQAHPFVSGAWMLGNTNDGFSGIDLDASALNAAKTVEVMGYDAGSEKNNEKKDYMPSLGGQMRDPENGVITVHTGIRGDADAPKAWAWDVSKPVARVTITPLAPRAGL